jgi:hypothetical protein
VLLETLLKPSDVKFREVLGQLRAYHTLKNDLNLCFTSLSLQNIT